MGSFVLHEYGPQQGLYVVVDQVGKEALLVERLDQKVGLLLLRAHQGQLQRVHVLVDHQLGQNMGLIFLEVEAAIDLEHVVRAPWDVELVATVELIDSKGLVQTVVVFLDVALENLRQRVKPLLAVQPVVFPQSVYL